MSWWIHRESRGGGRHVVLIDFPWLAALIIAGILLALLFPLIVHG